MYHGNVSFKAKEDLMSPHASKLSHIPGEEQSLLHRVCNVSTLSPSNIGVGSQAVGPIWGLLLFSSPFCLTLACLGALWTLSSRGGRVCFVPITPFPFVSLFLFNSAAWEGKAGGGVGILAWDGVESLAWAAFPVHPSQVMTLLSQANWTLVYVVSPSRRLMERMEGQD